MPNEFEEHGESGEHSAPTGQETPPPRVPGKRPIVSDSQVPLDSILGSNAEPVNAGRGFVSSDHPVHDADQTYHLPLSQPQDIPTDSILDDLAQDPSAVLDFEREQKSIRLVPNTMITNRFRVVKELGVGGMGAVYLVEDIKLQETRALKVMLPRLVADTVAQQRFLTEIKVLQRLSHESIVRVHDLGVDEEKGLQFFTMEFLPGVTLHKYLHQQGRSLPPHEVIDFAQKLCRALMYAHGKTIHRDLKPANVMLDESHNLTILDFGLAKLMTNQHLQMSNMVMGTFHYQSPEQRYDPTKVDRRTDLFSLGVMIYEMLTGEIPSGNFEPPSKVIKGIPKKLDRIVMRCLQNKPERRYQSAAELYDDLEAAKHGVGPFGNPFARKVRLPRGDESTPPTTTGLPQPAPRGATRALGVFLVAIILVLGAAFAFWATRDRPPPGGGPTTQTLQGMTTVELRAEATKLEQQVDADGNIVRFGRNQRLKGKQKLEDANARGAAGDENSARALYMEAIRLFQDAIEQAREGANSAELRPQLERRLADLRSIENLRAQEMLNDADLLLDEAVAEMDNALEPDYEAAHSSLKLAMQIADQVPLLMEIIPVRAKAEDAFARVDDRVNELREKDAAVFDPVSIETEAMFQSLNAGINNDQTEEFQGALDAFNAVIEAEQRVESKISEIASAQRIQLASAKGDAESDLVQIRDRIQAGMESTADLDPITVLLQEAAAAEADDRYTEAKTLIAKARNQSSIELAKLDQEAERLGGLKESIRLAKLDLEEAESTLAERTEALPDNAKQAQEKYAALKVQAEQAETEGKFDDAQNYFSLAKREVENVFGALDSAERQRMLVAAKDRAGESKKLYEDMQWDGEAPEVITVAMETFDSAAAMESTDEIEAKRLYERAADSFDEAAGIVTARLVERENENKQRLVVARAEAERAASDVPDSIREFVDEQLKAAEQKLDDASDEADIEVALTLLASARDEYRSAFDEGIRLAVEEVRQEAVKAEEAALVSQANAQSKAAETTAEERRAQGDPERTKGDMLIGEAVALLNTEAQGLDRVNEIKMASRKYTEADNAYKQAIKNYDQKTAGELAKERMDRLRNDATKGMSELDKLDSPYGKVEDLVAKSREQFDAAEGEESFKVALNTIKQAKDLHAALAADRIRSDEARAAAEKTRKSYEDQKPAQASLSYLKYQSGAKEHDEALTLAKNEDFHGAAARFRTAKTNFDEALRMIESERKASTQVAVRPTPAPAQPLPNATQPAATQPTPAATQEPVIQSPPQPQPTVAAAAPAGGSAAVETARNAAQSALQAIKDDRRYSALDKRKAQNMLDEAAAASGDQSKLSQYEKAAEFIKAMRPRASTSGSQ